MRFKVLIINFVILGTFLLSPAVALTFYKNIKSFYKKDIQTNYLLDHLQKNQIDQIKEMWNISNKFDYQYKSFTSWEPKKIESDLINIDGEYNTRKSLNEKLNNSNWFFGGSTMFGIGASDKETIPSNYASITNEKVMNFGTEDWASRQSLNKLINVIGDGFKPKKIIFYDGVNDINHQCKEPFLNEKIPLHNRELVFRGYINKNRNSAFFSNFLSFSNDKFNEFIKYIVAPYQIFFFKTGLIKANPYRAFEDNSCVNNPGRANLVAKHLVNNWFVAYQIAKSNNASFLGILQPNIFTSKSKIVDKIKNSHLKGNFDAVYPLIRQEMNKYCSLNFDFCQSLIDGSDWLIGSDQLIDFCHLTGEGNFIVASELNKVINNISNLKN